MLDPLDNLLPVEVEEDAVVPPDVIAPPEAPYIDQPPAGV